VSGQTSKKELERIKGHRRTKKPAGKKKREKEKDKTKAKERELSISAPPLLLSSL